MIDTKKKMREIVKEEPKFGEFLVFKGFPFTVKNPLTALVNFDQVAELKKLDKAAFLAEYEEWKEKQTESTETECAACGKCIH